MLVALCVVYVWSSYSRLNPPLLSDGAELEFVAPMQFKDEPEDGWGDESSTDLLSPAGSINYYLKQPGIGLYETIKAITG